MQILRTNILNKPFSHFGAFSNKCTKSKKLTLKSDTITYRFAFNGQERDDEVRESGNTIEFGGRSIFDPRLGRFYSIDPAGFFTQDISPYCFAGDNPIMFFDYNGCFRMTRRMMRKYPELALMLQNMQSYINLDHHAYSSFKEVTGMKDGQIQEMFTWGKGPKVKAANLWLWNNLVGEANGFQPGNRILIDKLYAENLQKEYHSSSNYEQAVWSLFLLVMHEAGHKGAKISGLPDDIKLVNGHANYPKERGFMLEGKLRYVNPDLANEPFGNRFFPFYQQQNLGGEKLSKVLEIPHSEDKTVPQDVSIKGDCSDPDSVGLTD